MMKFVSIILLLRTIASTAFISRGHYFTIRPSSSLPPFVSSNNLCSRLQCEATTKKDGNNTKEEEQIFLTILLSKAKVELYHLRNAETAFSLLDQIYAINPNTRGLQRLFEDCLRLRLDDTNNQQQVEEGDGKEEDRFGLAALFIDQERYEEASVQLRHIIKSLESSPDSTKKRRQQEMLDKARVMLFRTNASCCNWESYDILANHVQRSNNLHPFEALKWPCISLPRATEIASHFAQRAIIGSSTASTTPHSPTNNSPSLPLVAEVDRKSNAALRQSTKIRLGYLSPDFTSKHPLAFLLQHVFQYHNSDQFEVYIYSLFSHDDDEDGPEVTAIKNSCHSFTVLTPNNDNGAKRLAERIRDDCLDIIIDLCGFAGTSLIAEIMALRIAAPVQISYLGFPGSSGSTYMDYMICDPIVIPRNNSDMHIRNQYTEQCIYMPHCYFVNSHRTCAPPLLLDDNEKRHMRIKYGLPLSEQGGFVFCCHNRPDKIDPFTFRTWLRAILRIRNSNCEKREQHNKIVPVLWLLSSGKEMERNLKSIVRLEFGVEDSVLVFADIASREEHLKRMGCADVFLDTPAYNAHTLGCDSLFAGVPMISLLRPSDVPPNPNEIYDSSTSSFSNNSDGGVATTKLSSRVGGSLLIAAGLREFVCADMKTYETTMIRCATNREWYTNKICQSLILHRNSCSLFDTRRWITNLEYALRYVVLVVTTTKKTTNHTMTNMINDDDRDPSSLLDIVVVDNDP